MIPQISVAKSNKYTANNDMKKAGTSYDSLLPSSLRMQGQAPGNCNQDTKNKTPVNTDNEDNVMVLKEEE